MSHIEYVAFESKVLAQNPLGDPARRRFPVYLPPNYNESNESYPVLFGLVGFTGRGSMYLNVRTLTQSMDEILDELILTNKMPPAIYVMPDCYTKLGGSQYVNSTAVGRYEDYLVEELVPFIDKQFRTNGARACIGGSSGGIGSFSLAARHPDVFHGFADHSGDSAFEYCYLRDVRKFVNLIEKYDRSIETFINRIDAIKPKDTDFMTVLNLVAMAACYGANPDVKPLGFEMPFDLETGAINERVWQKFKEHDPVKMVEKYQDNLKKLKFCYVDCGTKDQFDLLLGARQVHLELNRCGVNHDYEEYDSDHFLLRFEQKKKSIPKLVKAILS